MSSDCMLVYITMPDKKSAREYCSNLVGKRLAACANIVDAVSSVYWWQGRVESASECICLFKTAKDRLTDFMQEAKNLHPYEVPCIVAWPLTEGNPDFFAWILAESTEAEKGTSE